MSEGIIIKIIRQGTKHRVIASNGQPIHADLICLAKAEDRKRFAAEVASIASGIEPHVVEGELLRIVANEAMRDPKDETESSQVDSSDALLDTTPEHVKIEAKTMLSEPALIQRIVEDAEALGVAGERMLTATVYVVGVSRLLPKPLATIIQGPTSSGKSYIYETVAKLFPPETVIHAKQMTPQALFHMKPGSLEHKFIVAGERSRIEGDEGAEATRALREMISSGELTKLMPMKRPDGTIETVSIRQKGPIAYIESTTLSKVFNEDANRCLMLQTDEREEQTRRIIAKAAAHRGGNGAPDMDGIILRHHAAQRMLRPMPVLIPFAEKLAEYFPAQRTEARRGFGHMMSMVEAVALLHQFQRQIDRQGRLVATPDDYRVAKYLLDSPMARLLGGRMSDAARRFLDRLKAQFPGFNTFTTRDAAAKESASNRAVRGWLGELADSGYVDMVEGGGRGKTITWKFAAAPPTDESLAALPGLEVIA